MVRPIWVEAIGSNVMEGKWKDFPAGNCRFTGGPGWVRCFKMRCPELPFGLEGSFG